MCVHSCLRFAKFVEEEFLNLRGRASIDRNSVDNKNQHCMVTVTFILQCDLETYILHIKCWC